MKFLFADEDVYKRLVDDLRNNGADVLTIKDEGLDNTGMEDGAVLELAKVYDRALITFNRKDFIRLHKSGIEHAGIIICKRNTPHQSIVKKIVALVSEEDEFYGRLFRITQQDD